MVMNDLIATSRAHGANWLETPPGTASQSCQMGLTGAAAISAAEAQRWRESLAERQLGCGEAAGNAA
jgi:hypothetical protein